MCHSSKVLRCNVVENELFREVLVYTKHMYIGAICLGIGTLIHYFKACGSLVIKLIYEEDHELIKEASEENHLLAIKIWWIFMCTIRSCIGLIH